MNGTIGLIAPSGALGDDRLVDRAAQALAARGWRVVAGDGPFRRHQRFAGTDDERLQELQAFCCDPTLDVVLAVRGGYGLSRLLDRIDFAAVHDAQPLVCGFSDFTAFNLAYLAQAGGISFQGPTIADFAGDDDFTASGFLELIGADRTEAEFACDGPATLDVGGRLWGGNLALVTALVGTRFLPRIRGGILFLEDINEPAYRVERMLYQLHHAGVLGRQRAVIQGDFTSPGAPGAAVDGLDLSGVVAQITTASGVPIVTGLPFGHGPRRWSLPVGGRGRLTIGGGRARLAIDRYPNLRQRRARRRNHSFG